MRKNMLSGLVAGTMLAGGLMLGSATADAADLGGYRDRGSIRDTPCCAPSWTGFYLGAGVGYGTFVNGMTTVDTASGTTDRRREDFGGDGGLGTVVIGYDHQVGNVVVGVFADFDWTGAKGSLGDNTGGGVPVAGSFNQDSAWAVGIRAGMLANSKTLLYLSGGYTEAKFDDFTLSSGSGLTTRMGGSQTFDGWFLGAGMETLLSQNLSLRLEYRYSDYGNNSLDRFNGPPPPGVLSTSHYDMDLTTHTGRLVLSYKFGAEGERVPLK